ncbi:MAG: inositol monophosphatase [Opitutae bacterium]|nr:inositol monophosphatase [Opitutae bacterium]
MTTELCQAARRVGAALARWSVERRFNGRRLGSQFKAEADRWAHELWTRELQAIAPGSTVISEEDEQVGAVPPPERYWLVDPLDGTASFVEGFPGWVTQVAWMENHRPVAAVVFAPLTEELFRAELGRGAFLNERPLVVDPTVFPVTLVDNYPEPRGIAAAAMQRFGLSRYLESGSIGLKICRVGAGHADVFVKDVSVKSWDVAPGDLLLSEAGGVLTTLDGQPFDYRGSVAHTGLIASRSLGFGREIAQWASLTGFRSTLTA